VETRRWEGARLGPTLFWLEVSAIGIPDVDVDFGKLALFSLPLWLLLVLPLLLVALFSRGLIWLRVEGAGTVVANLKLFNVLKNDVLLGMPEGVGNRDCVCTDAREVECGRLVVVRRRVKVLEVNLLSASENEVLRRGLGVVSEGSGCGCDCGCTSGGCAALVGCSAAAMACRVNWCA